MAYEQPTSDRNLNNLSQHRPALIGRRQALCTFAGIATAVAGIGLLEVGTAHAQSTATEGVPTGETVTADDAVRSAEAERELALVEALVPRDLDVGKWSIEKVHPVRFGAIAVVMRTPEGDAFQVDVLRRERGVAGVAETEHLSVFVANRGDGSKATEEWQARGAKVLAHHLRRTERGGSPLPQLMSFSQRAEQHPFGNYGVLG